MKGQHTTFNCDLQITGTFTMYTDKYHKDKHTRWPSSIRSAGSCIHVEHLMTICARLPQMCINQQCSLCPSSLEWPSGRPLLSTHPFLFQYSLSGTHIFTLTIYMEMPCAGGVRWCTMHCVQLDLSSNFIENQLNRSAWTIFCCGGGNPFCHIDAFSRLWRCYFVI